MTEEELRGMTEEELDELVHDMKSHEASNINNAGAAAQVEYLTESDARRKTAVASAFTDLVSAASAMIKGFPDAYDDVYTLGLLSRLGWAVDQTKGIESVCECQPCNAHNVRRDPIADGI